MNNLKTVIEMSDSDGDIGSNFTKSKNNINFIIDYECFFILNNFKLFHIIYNTIIYNMQYLILNNTICNFVVSFSNFFSFTILETYSVLSEVHLSTTQYYLFFLQTISSLKIQTNFKVHEINYSHKFQACS